MTWGSCLNGLSVSRLDKVAGFWLRSITVDVFSRSLCMELRRSASFSSSLLGSWFRRLWVGGGGGWYLVGSTFWVTTIWNCLAAGDASLDGPLKARDPWRVGLRLLPPYLSMEWQLVHQWDGYMQCPRNSVALKGGPRPAERVFTAKDFICFPTIDITKAAEHPSEGVFKNTWWHRLRCGPLLTVGMPWPRGQCNRSRSQIW